MSQGSRRPPGNSVTSTGGQLASAYDAFEGIRLILHERAEQAGHLIAPFVMAAAAAADGRDALAAAPSLAPGGCKDDPRLPALAQAPAARIADSLAEAARKLGARLAIAALTAQSPADRDAMVTASRHAATVCSCLAGTG